MRKVAFAFFALALLALALPADAGWSQSGQGQSGTGGITLPAGDLSGTGSSNANPTISNLTGTSGNTTVATSKGTIGVNLGSDLAVWGPVTVGSTNYGFDLGSNYAIFNAPSFVDFRIGNSQAMGQYTTSGLQLFSETQSLGGGTGVLGWTNAGTNPTSSPSGGSVCYSDASGGAFSEMTCRSPAGIIDEFGAAGSGTHNSQAGRLRARAYYVETTTSAGVTVTASDFSVASSTCEQYQVSWVGRNAAASLATSNVSTALCCNNAGTLSCGTSANTYAANVNTSGTLCTTSVATFAFGVSGLHPTFTVTCPQSAPVTVDWQLSLQGNVD